MSDQEGIGCVRLTASATVQRGPTLFYGLIMRATQLRETIVVYKCPDENDMFIFDNFVNVSKGSEPFLFPHPVYFDDGLYIKISGNVDAVLVFYKPLPPTR